MQYEEFIEKLYKALNNITGGRFEVCDEGIQLVIGDLHLCVHERTYDKFYTPFMEYKSRDEVVYKDCDINIAINNIRYAIMSEFEKVVFPRKN